MNWENMKAVRGWKDSPEFKERMSRVQKHIDKFSPTELEVVASCTSGVAVSP
jgi:heme-degrading monooxygenase HmoA